MKTPKRMHPLVQEAIDVACAKGGMTEPVGIGRHEGGKYLRVIHPADGKGEPIHVDVYAVLAAFNVTCPARQHAIKKLLCAGRRCKGSQVDDLQGAHAAVCRALEMQRQRETP